MSFTRFLRSHFFSTSGDTKINNFWTRFLDGSKPNQNTFEELTASAAFHAEINSAAQIDSAGALVNKQGLVIASDDASAKANSDIALGSTGGTKVPQNRHLPNVVDSITSQVIRDFNAIPLEVETNVTGSNNKYSLKLRTAFVTMLSKYLLPTISSGDTLKVVRVNAGETAYELATVTSGSGGDTYRGTSVTNVSITKGSKTFTVVPAAGTSAIAIGNRIRFSDSADSSRYIEGIVTATTGGTSVTINVDNLAGTGGLTTSNMNLGGDIPSTDTSGVANLYVDSLSGDDTTGNGSINKPFKTLSKAKSLVINNQTIIMFGGSYTNNVNVVKAGITYTLFCFPGVKITQTTTSFYDSLSVTGRVDIYGEPNIDSTALTGTTTFIVHEIARLTLGKIDGTYKLFDIYSRGNNLGDASNVQSNENTAVTFNGASWNSVVVPAIKLIKAVGTSAFGNGTILLNCKSLEFTPGLAGTNANYIEIADPYTVTITGNLQYRGSNSLTNPTLIKVTSANFAEIAINKLNCRLGGTVTSATIIDLGANNVSSKYFFVKDVTVSIAPATFLISSTTSSIYAEGVYMISGSTIQAGSATLKATTPAVTNTRTYVVADNWLATAFNI